MKQASGELRLILLGSLFVLVAMGVIERMGWR